jgi:preprotein translocase subunit SecD
MAENRFKNMFRAGGKGRVWRSFVVILVILIAASLVVFGGYYNKAVSIYKLPLPLVKDIPFRLGLDLLGGSQLTYDADVSAIPAGEQKSAVEGARDVIEKRVNVFGVSEPHVEVNSTADGKHRISVELAGIKDISEAIKKIGETPLLEFKEQNTARRSLTKEEEKGLNDFN